MRIRMRMSKCVCELRHNLLNFCFCFYFSFLNSSFFCAIYWKLFVTLLCCLLLFLLLILLCCHFSVQVVVVARVEVVVVIVVTVKLNYCWGQTWPACALIKIFFFFWLKFLLLQACAQRRGIRNVFFSFWKDSCLRIINLKYCSIMFKAF